MPLSLNVSVYLCFFVTYCYIMVWVPYDISPLLYLTPSSMAFWRSPPYVMSTGWPYSMVPPDLSLTTVISNSFPYRYLAARSFSLILAALKWARNDPLTRNKSLFLHLRATPYNSLGPWFVTWATSGSRNLGRNSFSSLSPSLKTIVGKFGIFEGIVSLPTLDGVVRGRVDCAPPNVLARVISDDFAGAAYG